MSNKDNINISTLEKSYKLIWTGDNVNILDNTIINSMTNNNSNSDPKKYYLIINKKTKFSNRLVTHNKGFIKKKDGKIYWLNKEIIMKTYDILYFLYTSTPFFDIFLYEKI